MSNQRGESVLSDLSNSLVIYHYGYFRVCLCGSERDFFSFFLVGQGSDVCRLPCQGHSYARCEGVLGAWKLYEAQ